MLVENNQAVGCVCLCTGIYLCWQTLVVRTPRKCVTDEWDDVGIFPSALLVLLPICVTGWVLTVKYGLIADSNRAYLCSCDLISLQPWFCWVIAKSTSKRSVFCQAQELVWRKTGKPVLLSFLDFYHQIMLTEAGTLSSCLCVSEDLSACILLWFVYCQKLSKEMCLRK